MNVSLADDTSPPYAKYGMHLMNKDNNVLSGSALVHVMWYGDWGASAPKDTLGAFISGLGQSPYWQVLATQYYNPVGAYVTGSIYLGEQIDYVPCGVYRPEWGAGALVGDAIARGMLPLDSNAMYLILGSPSALGGGYHGGLGYGVTNVAYCGTDGTIPYDCVLHELAESAVNNAWATNVSGGSWECADVCGDFPRKRLPNGTLFGGPTNVTIGGITFVTDQYVFDMRAQECSVASTAPLTPLLPRLGPQNSTGVSINVIGALNCNVLNAYESGTGSVAAAVAGSIVAAALTASIAYVTMRRLQQFKNIIGMEIAAALNVLHCLAALAAFVSSVIRSAMAVPVPPAIQQSSGHGWWYKDHGEWAIDVPLFDVAKEGAVLSPFRGVSEDYTAQVTLAAVALVVSFRVASRAASRPGSEALVMSAMCDALLVGTSVFSAYANSFAGVVVPAVLACLISAWRIVSIAPEAHPIVCGAMAALGLCMSATLLALRDDVASLSVNAILAWGSAADNSAACALTATCGNDETSGLPVVPFFITSPLRFGVKLESAYVTTGSFAMVAAAAWAVAAIRSPAMTFAAVLLQMIAFGTWVPMLSTLSRRSLVPGVVAQTLSMIGRTYTAHTPRAATAATAIEITSFIIAACVFVPRRWIRWVRDAPGKWIQEMRDASTLLDDVSTENLVAAGRAAQTALLATVAIVAIAMEASVAVPQSTWAEAPSIIDAESISVNITVGIPVVNSPPNLIFNPYRDASVTFPAITALAVVATVAAAVDVWSPATLALAAATLGAAMPTGLPELLVPASLAAAVAGVMAYASSPPLPSTNVLIYAFAVVAAILDGIACGFSFLGVANHGNFQITLTALGNRGPLANRLLAPTADGLVNSVVYSADTRPLCIASAVLSILAVIAWVASIVIQDPRVLCVANALQCMLVGAIIPFEAATFRRRLLPSSVVDIASVLGWRVSSQWPVEVTVATWCFLLAAAAGISMSAALSAAEETLNVGAGYSKLRL